MRDKNDKGKLLFDVSTIPCVPIDFKNADKAIKQVKSLLLDRIKEIDWRKSKRLAMTRATLTPDEIRLIRLNKNFDSLAWKSQGLMSVFQGTTLVGLLNKGILMYESFDRDDQMPIYTWTSFGNVIRNMWPALEEPVEPDSEPDLR